MIAAAQQGARPDIQTIGMHLTDAGNAERLVARFRDRIRYCQPRRAWLIWTDQRWAWDETGAIWRLAKRTVRAIYGEAEHASDDDRRKAISRHAHASESAARLKAMIELAQKEDGVPVMPADLDADPWLLNVENGTIDLRTGELREHRPDDMITKIVPVAYDAAAEAPIWRRFLSEIMRSNEKLVAFLARAVGYTLTGVTREQVLFFGIGSGSNGKTTFLKLLLRLLAEYGGQAPPELLLQKRNEVHPTEQADLFGRRLAVCTEIAEGRAWAEVTLKQLTGEDAVKARRMREDFWQFDPTHKFWIGANHKPTVRGTDPAIWRRLLLIPFLVTFDDAAKDKTLPEKLAGELPGILRWAVEGCLAWQREGLQPPSEVLAEVARYRVDMDVLGAFLRERCKAEEDVFVKAGDLYKAYGEWCENSGERPVKQRHFGRSLTERGFGRKTVDGRPYYVALRLLGLNESVDDVDPDPVSPSCDSSRGGDTRNGSTSSTNVGSAAASAASREATPEAEVARSARAVSSVSPSDHVLCLDFSAKRGRDA